MDTMKKLWYIFFKDDQMMANPLPKQNDFFWQISEEDSSFDEEGYKRACDEARLCALPVKKESEWKVKELIWLSISLDEQENIIDNSLSDWQPNQVKEY